MRFGHEGIHRRAWPPTGRTHEGLVADVIAGPIASARRAMRAFGMGNVESARCGIRDDLSSRARPFSAWIRPHLRLATDRRAAASGPGPRYSRNRRKKSAYNAAIRIIPKEKDGMGVALWERGGIASSLQAPQSSLPSRVRAGLHGRMRDGTEVQRFRAKSLRRIRC